MNKLVRACIALAAFAAFAVLPGTALAQNDATLLNVNNANVHQAATPVGTTIIGTANHNSFSRLTAADGSTLTQCTTSELTGTLTRNDHTEIAANITSAKFQGTVGVSPHTPHCTGSVGATHVNAGPATNGLPWCLQSKAASATHTFTVRGNECSKAVRPIRFTFNITTIFGAVHCEFQRTNPIEGTYTTTTTPVLKVEKQEFVRFAGSGLCPEKGFLDLEMQLHRPGAEPGLALVNAT